MEREQTTIRLPTETKREILREAELRDISFNEMVNLLIFMGLSMIHRDLS
jgi:hypothetical protein